MRCIQFLTKNSHLYPLECKTVSGPDDNKPCIFPFRFKGINYHTCTLEQATNGAPWCSTRVDKYGNHIGGQGNYGECAPNCPLPGATNKTF